MYSSKLRGMALLASSWGNQWQATQWNQCQSRVSSIHWPSKIWWRSCKGTKPTTAWIRSTIFSWSILQKLRNREMQITWTQLPKLRLSPWSKNNQPKKPQWKAQFCIKIRGLKLEKLKKFNHTKFWRNRRPPPTSRIWDANPPSLRSCSRTSKNKTTIPTCNQLWLKSKKVSFSLNQWCVNIETVVQ